MDSAYVRCGEKEYLLIGTEDGCLSVIKHNSQPQNIFQIKGEEDEFSIIEQKYEHRNAIVSIDVYPEGA
jgi:hypothetical protein